MLNHWSKGDGTCSLCGSEAAAAAPPAVRADAPTAAATTDTAIAELEAPKEAYFTDAANKIILMWILDSCTVPIQIMGGHVFELAIESNLFYHFTHREKV